MTIKSSTRKLKCIAMQMAFPGCHLKPERAEEVLDPLNVFNMMQFESLPITVDNVRREIQKDPVLSQVHEMVTKGWLSSHVPVLDPFYARRD